MKRYRRNEEIDIGDLEKSELLLACDDLKKVITKEFKQYPKLRDCLIAGINDVTQKGAVYIWQFLGEILEYTEDALKRGGEEIKLLRGEDD